MENLEANTKTACGHLALAMMLRIYDYQRADLDYHPWVEARWEEREHYEQLAHVLMMALSVEALSQAQA